MEEIGSVWEAGGAGKIRVAKRGEIQYKKRRFWGHKLRVWP